MDFGIEKLKQKDFFQTAVIDGGSIAWEDLHIDLDELIYECPDLTEKATASYSKKLEAALKKVLK